MFEFFGGHAQNLLRWRGHRVVRNAFWLYLVTFGGYIMPLLTLPYLSRILSVSNFGLIAYAQVLAWNCVTLTEYGFNITATRAVAFHRDNPAHLSRLASAVLAAKALLTLLGFLILAAFVLLSGHTRPHWPLFFVTFLTAIAHCLFPLWLYQGLEIMGQVAARDFFAKLLGLITLFVFVRSDADVFWAAAAPSVGIFVAALLGLWRAPRIAGIQWTLPTWPEVRAQLLEGWPPFLNAGAAAAAHSLSVYLLALRGMNAEIGYFNAALRLAGISRNLIQPLSTTLYAYLSHQTRGEEAPAIAFVRSRGIWLTLPFFAIAVVSSLLAPWAIPTFLSAKFHPAVLPFCILSFGNYIFAVSHLYTTYFMLPCGFERQVASLYLLVLPLTFAMLPVYLVTLPGSLVLACNALTLDLFATLAYWRFYRKRVELIQNAGSAA